MPLCKVTAARGGKLSMLDVLINIINIMYPLWTLTKPEE
jgi:hypothetical protein